MSVGVSCNFMDTVLYSKHNNGRCCTIVLYRQMLCLIMADDIANCEGVWQMVSHRGRCYNFYADQSGQCYCHGGRWNGSLRVCYFI